VDKLAINVDNPAIMCKSVSFSLTQITYGSLSTIRGEKFSTTSMGYLEVYIYPQKVGISFPHIAKVVDKKEKISPARVHNLSPCPFIWG
jgi:hypothetical protein